MRIAVLGGTRFIGRRIVEELAARGDNVLVVHRGRIEADEPPAGVRHLHVDRAAFATVADRVREFAPERLVDTIALTAADVDAVLPHLPAGCRVVALSSVDVYRAFALHNAGEEAEGLPIDEESAVRAERYPYRGVMPGYEDYDKLDVEDQVLAAGGAALRLGVVYGEHDPQRREDFVLRRVRAGRARLPIGAGTALLSRVYVGDVAAAVLAAVDAPEAAVAGRVFNVVEPRTRSAAGWAAEILAAAGHRAEIVRVPEELLPADLELTAEARQHVLVDAGRARRELGWRCADPAESLSRSVAWHLANPPKDPDPDFTPDDHALAAADARASARTDG